MDSEPAEEVAAWARPGSQSVAKNHVARVFVSSTFRDMVEDRNELMSHVWPALRKLCRERAVELTADRTGTCSVSPNDTIVYHSGRGLLSPKSAIFNLISEMSGFDSHVPGAIPAQFLLGLVLVVLGGWLGLMLRCQMAWTGRCQVLQPVCRPVR